MITQKLLFTVKYLLILQQNPWQRNLYVYFCKRNIFKKRREKFRWSLIELCESGFGPLRWAAGYGAKRRENCSVGWKQRCRQVSNETAEYHMHRKTHTICMQIWTCCKFFLRSLYFVQKLHIFLLDTPQSKPVSEKMATALCRPWALELTHSDSNSIY